ncbi:SDR family oxidoreductase [Patescibacteria group bacterium]|nr:SDR family oxidoreductase [Patescibacteria group bacterium]
MSIDEKGKILVTGAGGNVAGAVVKSLLAKGASVRALVHDESKAKSLKEQGVEVVKGDMTKPETLGEAFNGVSEVFLLTPNSPDAVTMAINVINAAKGAGVSHIVRQSVMKAATDSPIRTLRLHAEVEEELKKSEIAYTIIRPQFFMQNTLSSAESVKLKGVLSLPLKDAKIGMIDVRDIGEVVAHVLTTEGHEGKTYTITGPKTISLRDAAAALSKAVGKEVKYMDAPLEAAGKMMMDMGMPKWEVEALGEQFTALGEGFGDFVTDDVQELLGRPARTFEQFTKDLAPAFKGS